MIRQLPTPAQTKAGVPPGTVHPGWIKFLRPGRRPDQLPVDSGRWPAGHAFPAQPSRQNLICRGAGTDLQFSSHCEGRSWQHSPGAGDNYDPAGRRRSRSSPSPADPSQITTGQHRPLTWRYCQCGYGHHQRHWNVAANGISSRGLQPNNHLYGDRHNTAWKATATATVTVPAVPAVPDFVPLQPASVVVGNAAV